MSKKKSLIVILAVAASIIVACGNVEERKDLSNNGALENILEGKAEQDGIAETKQEELLVFLSKKTSYSSNGKVAEMIEYDNKGNRVRSTGYKFSDGSIYYCFEYYYRYDDIGNTIMTDYSLSSEVGGIGVTVLCEYDAAGNIVKEIGEKGTQIDIEYDAEGNEVKKILTDEEGGVIAGRESEYEYNAKGNKIKRTVYSINDNSTREFLFWTDYEYDKQGNVLKETFYTAEGEISGWTTYEYGKIDSNSSVKEYQYAESTIKADDINIITHLVNAIEIYFSDPAWLGKSGSLRCVDGNITIDAEIQDALNGLESWSRMGITIMKIPEIKSSDYQNWEINFSESEITFSGNDGDTIKECIVPHLISIKQIK